MQATMRVERVPIRFRRTPVDFAIIFGLVMVCALVAAIVGWQVWHTNRIYSGVTVAGVPVGGLTRAAALTQVSDSLARYPLPSVSVTYGGRQWSITGDDVPVSTDLLAAVNQAYLVGRTDTWSGNISAQLGAALGAADISPQAVLDTGQLQGAIEQIAAEIREPARAAAQMGDVVVPAQPGIDVDVEATVAALTSALDNRISGQPIVAEVVVTEVSPPTQTFGQPGASATLSADSATSIATREPLLLRNSQFGLSFALDPAMIQSLAVSGDPAVVDEAKLRAVLEGWAAQIEVTPRDARLTFDQATQSPVVILESRPGRRLDIDATAETIRGALANGWTRADLMVVTVPPAVDSNRVAEMGIREVVAQGVSYPKGSSGERMRNIGVAAEKFEGVVIPPDGIFSFNQFVEDVSAANGFEDGLIIWGDRTAVGIGGGVCQVSTTIFRAAYNAGLPIVERYNHGYVVSWYGEPGLDATIFTPTVDFRFRNDTGAYLLIEPVFDMDAGVLTINLYGTKPDRQVIVSDPVIRDIVPPPPALYTLDESLAPGQTKQVDWEQQGMTVEVTRTIIENGQSRSETLTSKYQPWRAIYLVGSESQIPGSAQPSAAQEAPVEGTAPVTEEVAPPAETAPPVETAPPAMEAPTGEAPATGE
jgi:vancomycin resistance protein YoaR